MANPEGIARIVVGVDGSEHSAAAIQWAIRMAKGMGSEVIAVFAIGPPVYYVASPYEPATVPFRFDDQWRADMKKEFEEDWCKPLRDAGARFRAVVEDGRPASVIAKTADDNEADLVVVGRRGRSGVAELLLGSVSHELVLHCRRPVLVISNLPS